jgi:hypothetical protein
MKKFNDILYLREGNDRQRFAYRILTQYAIIAQLHVFTPIVVGTIPIEIDIETSDIDIICTWNEKNSFIKALEKFSHHSQFTIFETTKNERETVIARFVIENICIEVFGQRWPVFEQEAYRHMIVEHRLLVANGEMFKQQIVDLKRKGVKTEPAFAMLLGLKGDPYIELLSMQALNRIQKPKLK